MKSKPLTFKDKTERFANGIRCYVGTVHIASIDWDSMSDRDRDKPYKITLFFSMKLKEEYTRFETQAQAKEVVEQAWHYWLAKVTED